MRIIELAWPMTSQGNVGSNAVLTIGITMPAGYPAKTGMTRPLPNPNSDLRRVFFNCQLAHLLIKKANGDGAPGGQWNAAQDG